MYKNQYNTCLSNAGTLKELLEVAKDIKELLEDFVSMHESTEESEESEDHSEEEDPSCMSENFSPIPSL